MELEDRVAPQPPSVADLPGAGRRQLVAALLAAYDEAGLAQVARFSLDQDLPEIAGGRNLREVAFNLVEWAASHGRLADLVAGALADRPGNPELQLFARDVWPTRQTVAAGDLTSPEIAARREDVAAEPPDRKGTFWRSLPGVLTGIAAVITAVVALVAALANAGVIGNVFGIGANPRVVISNAMLRQQQTTDTGEEVLDIAYDVELIDYGGKSVLVDGTVLDAASRQQVRLPATITPNVVSDDEEQDREVGTLLVPMPQRSGCIIIRVAAFDAAGDELSYDETPSFDPFDPANPSCPPTAMATQPPA